MLISDADVSSTADPKGEQLRELQRLLIRLMRGETNAKQEGRYSHSGYAADNEVLESEWAASLPFSFIWLGM